MKKVVVEVNSTLYVIKVKNFIPKNYIGDLPMHIAEEDYPYIVKVAVYDEFDSEVINHYTFEVDQALKDADPNFGVLLGDM